jgi:hypothetical protein
MVWWVMTLWPRPSQKNALADRSEKIISKEDFAEIWDTLDTCHEKPEKYMAEALKPIQ